MFCVLFNFLPQYYNIYINYWVVTLGSLHSTCKFIIAVKKKLDHNFTEIVSQFFLTKNIKKLGRSFCKAATQFKKKI